jgi:hypothetical protein
MSKNKTFLIVENSPVAEVFVKLVTRLATGMKNGCSIVFAFSVEDAYKKAEEDTESEFFVMADLFQSSVTIESFRTELRNRLGGRLRETVITSSYGDESRPEAKAAGALFLLKPFDIIDGEDWKAVAEAIETFLTT